MRVTVRGFVSGRAIFTELIDAGDSDVDNIVESVARQHSSAMACFGLYTIEIEFLDDSESRYLRFGTDPSANAPAVAAAAV